MAECFNNSLSRGASSLPNHWQERWWIHLSIAEPSTPQDLESGGNGLGISMFRATLATANYTLPYSRIWNRSRPRPSKSLEFHVVADPGKSKLRNFIRL